MTSQTSKPTIRSTISMTVGREIEAQDLQAFLAKAPSEAIVRITVNQGDSRDPREAGMFTVTITAAWEGVTK